MTEESRMSPWAVLFLIAFVATLVLALVRHPIYGLYAYFLGFYGFPPARWWGADLPDLRWLLIAAAVTMISVLRMERTPNKPRWYANAAAISLIAFTAWLWLQQFWALDPAIHQYFAVTYTKFIIFFYLMYRVIEDENAVFLFSLAHVAGCVYYGWLAFNVTGGGRIGFIGGPNMDGTSAFSAHMTTGLIFAGILLLQTRGIVRILLVLTIPFILNGIIVTQSRGAFLGLVAGGLVVLILCPPAKRKIAYSAAALGAMLFLMLTHEVFWQRMETIVHAVEKTEEMDGSAEGRWVIVDAQWKMFRLHPIRGSGHRGTVVHSARFIDERHLVSSGGRSSHNTFMSLIVEQGIIGTAIYIAMAAWALLRLLQLKARDSSGLPASLGLYRAAIGGSLANLFVTGQFADFLRLEITIWLLVLLVIVSQLAQDAVGNRLQSSSLHSNRDADIRNLAAKDRTVV